MLVDGSRWLAFLAFQREHRRMWRAVFVLVMLALPNVGAAQQNEEAAREAFERGERAFEREVFTEAEDAFRESYEHYRGERRALILFNLATVVEAQGGRDAEALELWRSFRRDAASVADAEQLVRADDRIRELEARIERRRSGAGGGGIHPVGPIVLGVGGAALIAAAIVGGVSLDQDAAFREACADLSTCRPELRSQYDEMRAFSAAADVLWVTGSLIAATGLVLTLILRDSAAGEGVSVSCGFGGCQFRGRF